MRPIRPARQVRRTNVRPTYSRRRPPASRRPSPQLVMPTVQIGWIKTAALGVVALLLLLIAARLTSIQRVTVTPTKVVSTDHVQRLAQEGLDHQWFGRNITLTNTSSLSQYIVTADPGIKTATVKRQWFHALVITITERQPAINWKTGGTVYVLDADATVIGPTKGVYTRLPVVTDSTNLPVKGGQQVASTGFVLFASQVAKQLPGMGFAVADMAVPETTTELNVRTSTGIILKFDTTRPATDELADLKAVQVALAKAKKAPTQYIDLRIAHKAYYK